MRHLIKIVLMAMIAAWPAVSYADWHHDDHSQDSHHDDHHDGHRDSGYASVHFDLWPSYYGTSYYYPPAGDVLISSPVYEPVSVNGNTYYLNDSVYYVYNGYGYEPVADPVVEPPPQAIVQPPPVIDQAVAGNNGPDSLTINIPNSKGGYTAVTLTKKDNGFVGPQGEFYPEFPKVSQLEVIYGNKK